MRLINLDGTDVRFYYQTHTNTELSIEIHKYERLLKTGKLDQQRIYILKQLFSDSEIIPQWYRSVSDIPPELHSPYADDSEFLILEDVELALLMSLLSCGNAEILLDKEKYYLFNQKKTEAIFASIEAGKTLIPPTVSFDDASDGLVLSDGKHRFRSAFVAEQGRIPVLVAKRDYSLISEILTRS